jgi:hypothetical protein
MIIDIPTPEDFESVGLHLLNSAWDTAASLLCDIDEAAYFDVDTTEIKEAFWAAARVQLSTALATAQHGSEFLLKGRIARLSPYLLLGAMPRDWPTGCATKPTPFSDFRTIDAQDLVKVHNTTCDIALPEEFVSQFDELRRKRNAVLHSIDKRLSVHASELLVVVLSINHHLGSEKNWVNVRHQHFKNSPLSKMHSEDYADQSIVREFSIVRNLLSPAHLKRYFQFDKKQRNYICPNCAYSVAENHGLEPRTALLKPNAPKAQSIWCFVCGETQDIEREDCPEKECKGNVLSEDWGHCLTCGASVR